MGGIRRAATFVMVVAAVCAVVLIVSAPAAMANSCPQASSLLNTGLTGTGGLSYVSGNVSTTVDQDRDDTQSTSLDHHASGMKIVLPKPEQGSGGSEAFNQPSGGTVTVNDTFSDTGDDGDLVDLQSPPSSSHQTYSGPNKPASGDSVTLNVNSNCTYNISFGFDVSTTTVANGPLAPNQPGEGDQAQSPDEPIPADLKLSATVTIHPVFGGNCLTVCYDLSGDPYWGGSLDLDANSPGIEPGTATMTWQLSPTGATSKGCLVPHLKGLSLHAAGLKLEVAGCKLGKVTHKRSSSVPKGKVISSNPKAGTKHPAGTKVAVVISSG